MTDERSFYMDLLDNLSDGVYFTDLERRILYWNRGAERITGFRREEVLGSSCMDNVLRHVDAEGTQLCFFGCPLAASTSDGNPREAEVFLHHKDGHRVPIWVRTAPVRDSRGVITGAVEIFSDITLKKQVEERLAEMERLALADTLTGLANRRHMEMHIQARLEEFRRFGWPCGCLFIDVDHFKGINDKFGHDVGDRVLKMIAHTLKSNARFSEEVGRWGGEEFIIAVAGSALDKMVLVAERFRMLVQNSYLLEPENIRATISVGCALGQPEDSLDSLVNRADEMLYQAKQGGRNRVCY
jgi:diguanylate cyclase (GGDEF)-like protein/PAS domain S-box-containing protein